MRVDPSPIPKAPSRSPSRDAAAPSGDFAATLRRAETPDEPEADAAPAETPASADEAPPTSAAAPAEPTVAEPAPTAPTLTEPVLAESLLDESTVEPSAEAVATDALQEERTVEPPPGSEHAELGAGAPASLDEHEALATPAEGAVEDATPPPPAAPTSPSSEPVRVAPEAPPNDTVRASGAATGSMRDGHGDAEMAAPAEEVDATTGDLARREAPSAGASPLRDRDWADLSERLQRRWSHPPDGSAPRAAAPAARPPLELLATLTSTEIARAQVEPPRAETTPKLTSDGAVETKAAPIDDAPRPIEEPPPVETTGDGTVTEGDEATPLAPRVAAPSTEGIERTETAPPPRIGATSAAPERTAPKTPSPAATPEAPVDTDRHEIAASAVNRMTLRRGADAEIDVPELGRIRVSAHTVGHEVDVELSSREAAAVAILHSTRPQMTSELRAGEIDLRHFDIHHDQSSPHDQDAARDRADRRDEGGRADRDGTGRATSSETSTATSRPTSPGRVRVVL